MPTNEASVAASEKNEEMDKPSSFGVSGAVRISHSQHVRHTIYPIVAGIPTAVLILYFFDFGQIYRDVVYNLLSPIITGVISGTVLYVLGLRR